MINPAEALAIAPVVRFAILLRRGNEDEEDGTVLLAASTRPDEVRMLDPATWCRRAFKPEK